MFYYIHKQILENLYKNLSSNVFTSCEVGFFYKNKNNYKNYLLYVDKNNISFSSKKYFDLASLTKIIVTVPCVWSLLSENKFLIDTRIKDIYPEYTSLRRNITIGDLVNHISGLSSHRDYSLFLEIPEKDRFAFVENNILEKLCEKGEKNKLIYSDLGYILLGRIIEKISGKKLDEYWIEKVFKPLNLESLFYLNKRDNILVDKFISTGVCDRTGKILQGIVNDANCRFLGGICGHAGLFGNGFSLLDFIKKILFLYKGNLVVYPFDNNILKDNIDKKVESRRFGFDTPSKINSSCGKYFSDLTIGHLGFTGTSIWLDLKKEVGVILLTNRTYKGDKKNCEEIRLFRQQIHNIIMKNIPCI